MADTVLDRACLGPGSILEKEEGWTLLETMVVAAILVLMTAYAVAWCLGSAMPDLRLKIAVRHLKSDLHLARLAAIRANTYTVTEFHPDSNSYLIFLDNGGGNNIKANNYSRDPGEPVLKTTRLHPHVNIMDVRFGSVPDRFAFNSRGAVDGLAGRIYLRSRNHSYRGVTVSRIGKLTIKASKNGEDWYRLL